MPKIFNILLFGIIIFIFNPCTVFANQILFEDDFSNGLDKWEVISGNWEINNEILETSINEKQQSSALVAGDSSWTNYQIDVDILMKYGIDVGIWFRGGSFENKYSLNPRFPGAPTSPNLKLNKRELGNNAVPLTAKTYNFNHDQWYHFSIIINDYNFKILVDNDIIIDFTDSAKPSSLANGKIGLQGYSGNEPAMKALFDNIKVTNLNNENPNPIILIPGFWASWNWSIFLNGYTAPGQWTSFPPGLKKFFYDPVYKNLEDTLLLAGYENSGENQNLFTFYYNYLSPMEVGQTATTFKLKQFIDENIGSYGKATIIGHSMGGLLSRIYLQLFNENKVDKLITFGSPHKGVIGAYKGWEGGVMDDWQKLLAQIFLKQFHHPALALRSIAPSLKEMIPVFNFITNQNAQTITSWDQIAETNYWLSNKNNNLNQPVKDLTNTIYGESFSTEEWLNVIEPSIEHKLLGIWRDGYPANSTYTQYGDNTVLTTSANLPNIQSYSLNKNHRKIVSSPEGIQQALDLLNITNIDPVINNYKKLDSYLIFKLFSPVNIKVSNTYGEVGYNVGSTYPESYYDEENNFIFIPNPQSGEYNINLSGYDSDKYELVIGQVSLDDSKFYTLEGLTENGKNDVYRIYFDENKLLDIPLIDNTGLALLNLTLEQIQIIINLLNNNSLNNYPNLDKAEKSINKAITNINNNQHKQAGLQIKNSILHLSLFRRKLDKYLTENLITDKNHIYLKNEINQTIELLAHIWVIIHSNSSQEVNINSINNLIELSEKTLQKLNEVYENVNFRLSVGNSIYLSKNYLKIAKNSIESEEFGKAYINAYIARLLTLEAWIMTNH